MTIYPTYSRLRLHHLYTATVLLVCGVLAWVPVEGFTGAAIPGGVYIQSLWLPTDASPQTEKGLPIANFPSAQCEGAAPASPYSCRAVMVAIPLQRLKNEKPATFRLPDGTRYTFTITPHDYGTQHIEVSGFSTYSEEQLTRFKEERAIIRLALSGFTTPEDLDGWGVLASPVRQANPLVSSPFGLLRNFNQSARFSFHTGTDLALPLGTPVLAAADGHVVLTGHFFFNGKSVFIDHGYGLYSVYFHLSVVDVKKGQRVRVGERVGAVGSTGRSTAPHLHFGTSLQGSSVNPAIFLPIVEQWPLKYPKEEP